MVIRYLSGEGENIGDVWVWRIGERYSMEIGIGCYWFIDGNENYGNEFGRKGEINN